MRFRTWIASLALLPLLAACPAAPEPTTTTSPPPATAEEMRVFCEKWSEVHAIGGPVLPESLIEVAPAEIEDVIIRMTSPPGPGWEQDFERFNEFVSRCQN